MVVLLGLFFFFFQAEDGIRDLVRSRGLGDVYKRQDQERNGKRLIADQYQNPEAVYVYWEDQDSFLELAVTGRQVNDFIVNTDFFSYFNINAFNPGLCGN